MSCTPGEHDWVKVIRSKNMYLCTLCLDPGWMVDGSMFEESDDV